MTHDPSRKSFLAKMIGLVAGAGLAPRLLARTATQAATAEAAATGPRIVVKPDVRAVARRAGSV